MDAHPSNEISEQPAEPPRRVLRFIAVALIGAVLLITAHLAMGAATIGRTTSKSAGMCTQIKDRVTLGQQISGPRLLLVGGSGVRAGLSAELLSAELGVNAFNFGLLASLGPEFILSEARKVAEPGDVVVLLLEYPQMVVDGWNPISVDYALACGSDTLWSIGAGPLVTALFEAGPWRMVEVMTRKPVRRGQQNWEENLYGDRGPETFVPLSDAERKRVDLYQPVSISVAPESRGARAIAKFSEWASGQGITVVASWPNTIAHDVYDSTAGFEQIMAFYNSVGISFLDTPQRGLYPRSLFYDTQYHLTYDGIRTRTLDFATSVRQSDFLQRLAETTLGGQREAGVEPTR